LATLQGLHVRESDDLAELASLGERLLTPAELRETAGERGFFLGPALKDVFARANGAADKEPFRSAAEFAAALERALVGPAASPTRVRRGRRLATVALALLGTGAAGVGAAAGVRMGLLGPALTVPTPVPVTPPRPAPEPPPAPVLPVPALLLPQITDTPQPMLVLGDRNARKPALPAARPRPSRPLELERALPPELRPRVSAEAKP
jgi:hypothetical protein